ncbi:hypothetical protein QM565_19965 [Geitlerinema splendidum]|nr:hypothetical protein [Geitlerinema splendidum]
MLVEVSKNAFINPEGEANAERALGIWQPQQRFDYGLVMRGFNSQRFLKLMDW